MRTVPRLTALALAGALTLSGCTSDDEPTADPAADTQDAAPADGEATDSEAEATDDTTTGVIGVDFPDPDDVVADATFTRPGTENEVRVGIESLTVRGDLTELRLVFTPLYGQDPVNIYDMLGPGSDIDLLDRQNLKEYRNGYTTDVVDAKAAPGESVGYQAFFDAPVDDIDVLDVKISDAWPVFEDVPLTFED